MEGATCATHAMSTPSEAAPPRYTKEEAMEKKGLLAEEYDELMAAFDQIDVDRSGFLEFDQVVAMVRIETRVSLDEAQKYAKEQLAMMDAGGDKRITFNEYVDALS